MLLWFAENMDIGVTVGDILLLLTSLAFTVFVAWCVYRRQEEAAQEFKLRLEENLTKVDNAVESSVGRVKESVEKSESVLHTKVQNNLQALDVLREESQESGKGLADQLKEIQNLNEELKGAVGSVHKLLVSGAESQADRDFDTSDGAESDSLPGGEPRDKQAYIDSLKQRGAKLDFESLTWTRKGSQGDTAIGNTGWFVADSQGRRYYIRRGRTVTVLKVSPQSWIDEWRRVTSLDVSEVKTEYQVGSGSGNHAWYIKIHSGRTWKISAGGHGKTGLTVAESEEE